MKRLWSVSAGRLGMLVSGTLLVLALASDLLASDLPLLLHYQGDTHLLPNLTRPPGLRGHTHQSLLEAFGPQDWMLAAPIPWGPDQPDLGRPPLEAPGARHWLGTDLGRRDVLARLIHGTRVTLLVGLGGVSLYVLIGMALGFTAGFYGGWWDTLVSRVTEVLLSIPVFFVILPLMGVMESPGLGALVLVIAGVYWTRIARLARAEALRLRVLPFVEAARSAGLQPRHVLWRHVIPHGLAPIGVSAAFGVAGMILVEASLSFLGFGTPDEWASWGGLMRDAAGHFHAWWLSLFPSLALFAAVLGCNGVGEALRTSTRAHGMGHTHQLG